MDAELTYVEKQRFNQTWLWITLIIAGLLVMENFARGFYVQIINGKPWGNNPTSDTALITVMIIVSVIFMIVYFIIGFSKLTVIIDSKGIHYKFFPFHWKFKYISWDSVDKFGVVTYNPLKDYGGWGVRFSKKGKAYGTDGDKGLQLYLKSGKKILLGTQKANDLVAFLTKIK
jgi:hypothetical protein